MGDESKILGSMRNVWKERSLIRAKIDTFDGLVVPIMLLG